MRTGWVLILEVIPIQIQVAFVTCDILGNHWLLNRTLGRRAMPQHICQKYYLVLFHIQLLLAKVSGACQGFLGNFQGDPGRLYFITRTQGTLIKVWQFVSVSRKLIPSVVELEITVAWNRRNSRSSHFVLPWFNMNFWAVKSMMKGRRKSWPNAELMGELAVTKWGR